MKYTVLLFVILSMVSCSLEKQIRQQGREYVDILASDSLHGRGYTHDGILKAEKFIAKTYNDIGLVPVYSNYRQEVIYPINIIQHTTLVHNGNELTYGTDYILKASASTSTLSAKVFNLNHSLLDRSLESDKLFLKTIALNKGNIPVLDYRNVSDSMRITLDGFASYLDREKTLYGFPALIKITKKLTQSLAQEQDNFMVIETTQDLKDRDTITLDVLSNEVKTFQSNNLVGMVKGTETDSAIIITAHYDHLGQINETIFNGANDNASGVSMLLTLAKYYQHHEPKHSIYFYALTGEEVGLKGADVAANNLPIPQENIRFLLNLDIVGTGDEGIQVVNSTIFQHEFQILEKINKDKSYFKNIKLRGEACNSDHCPFYYKGIPSFFIYTLGGIDAYHDPLDKPQTLPLTKFYELYQLLTQFIEQL